MSDSSIFFRAMALLVRRRALDFFEEGHRKELDLEMVNRVHW